MKCCAPAPLLLPAKFVSVIVTPSVAVIVPNGSAITVTLPGQLILDVTVNALSARYRMTGLVTREQGFVRTVPLRILLASAMPPDGSAAMQAAICAPASAPENSLHIRRSFRVAAGEARCADTVCI